MTKNTQRLTFLTLLLLTTIPLVIAQPLPMCDSEPAHTMVGQNCRIRTPALNCTFAAYDYDIYNETGSQIQINQALSLIGQDIYEFNFTDTTNAGEYIVRLCDGSTLQIEVGDDDDTMALGFIVILPILFAGLLVLIGNSLNEDEHMLLRVIFSLMGVLSVLFSIWFSFIVQDTIVGSSPLENALSIFLWISLLLIFSVFAYMFLYLLVKYLKMVTDKKNSELQY